VAWFKSESGNEADVQTDRDDCIQSHANAVDNELMNEWFLFSIAAKSWIKQ